MAEPDHERDALQRLCASCQRFCNDVSKSFQPPENGSQEVEKLPWPTYSSIIHTSTEDLSLAADGGCFICKLVRLLIGRAMEWTTHGALPPVSRISLLIEPRDQKSRHGSAFPVLSAAVQFQDERIPSLKQNLAWYTTPPEGNLATALRDCSTLLDDSTGSKCAFRLASYWLNNCLENHSCSHRRDSAPLEAKLPTRVIDVGPPDGSQEPYLRQISASDQGPYIALSHCWGKERLLTTTKDTFDDRCKQIPLSSLPKTFQDAVLVVRKFNVRYLWIDSLCIIQDSTEDWSAESKTMCRIYQDCLFTIAAGHAEGSRFGCFVQRDGDLHRPLELPIRPHFLKQEPYRCWFEPIVPTVSVNTPDLPLHTRAWVLQEQVLSPRTLLFDTDEIHWQCMAMHGSERSPQGGIARHLPFMHELRSYVGGITSEDDDVKKRFLWSHTFRTAVHEYSCRSLTQWSDKLIAIYGVADALRNVFGGEYICGLWKEDFLKGLLWYVPVQPSEIDRLRNHPAYKSYPACRVEGYTNPSWSWASAESAIVYYEIPNGHLASLNIISRIVNLDDLHDGTVGQDSTAVKIEGDTRVGYVKCTYRWDTNTSPSASTAAIFDSHSVFRNIPAIPNTTWFPEEDVRPDTPVTFIALAESPGDNGFIDRPASTVYALGLVPIDKEGKYRRVGLAVWSRCSWYGYNCPVSTDDGAAATDHVSGVKKYTSALARRLQIGKDDEAGSHQHPLTFEPFIESKAYKKGVRVQRTTLTIV